ncbi:MAG: CBS domain-containing protein [Alphaproteobacteria bacterium]|nr:CBS domain-containing protein [Alphaproteobacteria bacterium]
MKVSEILKLEKAPLVVVSPDTTILTASHRMRLEKVGCVIVSKDGEHPDGIVAVRDVVYNMAGHWGENPDGSEFSYISQPVSAIMHSPVQTCRLDQRLRDVLHIMWHWHFLHVPVMDDRGEMCGIISIDDVIRFSVHEMETESRVLHERVMLSGQRPVDRL